MANQLFGAKFVAIGNLTVDPQVPLELSWLTECSRKDIYLKLPQKNYSQPPTQPSGTFVTIPIAFLKKLIADQRQTKALDDEIVHWMPQMIYTKVSYVKKEITSQVQKELGVHKERLDRIENLVQDRFQVASQTETDELKLYFVDMRSQMANLAKKLIQFPPPELPESLMQILNQEPPVQ